jgi:4-amino-4-deoxy-L-arabinose transferase-like glycosyltransferase
LGEALRNSPALARLGHRLDRLLQSEGKSAALYLGGLLFLYLLQLLVFVLGDTAPAYSDSVRHLVRSAKMYYFLTGAVPYEQSGYAPLLYLVTAAFYALGGFNEVVARLSVFAFAALLVICMYFLGRHYGGRPAAVVAAALILASPTAVFYGRYYFAELPNTAMLALAFLALLKTRAYTDSGRCLWAGGALALAFLTKWQEIFFLFVPMFWLLAPQVVGKGIAGRLLGAILAFFAILAWKMAQLMTSGAYFPQGPAWLVYWLTWYFVPLAGLWAALGLVRHRLLPRWDPGERDGAAAVLNFGRMLAVPALVGSLWVVANADAISARVALYQTPSPGFWDHPLAFAYTTYAVFCLSGYSYLWFFAGCGLVYLYLRPENLYQRLLLPASVLATAFWYAHIVQGPTSPRYFLAWLIFTVPLGSYWVSYLGPRPRRLVSWAAVILALLCMYGWMLPGPLYRLDDAHLREARAWILLPSTAAGPREVYYDLREVVDLLRQRAPKGRILFTDAGAFREADRPMSDIEWEHIQLELLYAGTYAVIEEVYYTQIPYALALENYPTYVILFRYYGSGEWGNSEGLAHRFMQRNQMATPAVDKLYNPGAQYFVRFIGY